MKTISADATVTELQVIEPQILSADLNVTTNFEEVKQNLKAITEKYVGLVVTDQNQKDMEKTLREVVSLRTNIQKFEVNGKRQLRRPMDQFAEACKELLKIVNEAERPLREQLDAYEARRQEGVTKVILHKYEEMALDAGIREEFRSCEILSKWMNKTAKLKDIYEDISRLVSEQATAQKQHDDLKELRNSRRELALLQIEKSNRDYALATPITEDFLTDELLDTSAEIIKNTINEEALRRHEMDENARQVSSPAVSAPPPAAKPPVVPIPQVEPGVSWPKVMTVTITLNSSFDYQAVENVLSSLPPQIRWNSDIKEI
ncbi:DUF1351 domain-containing protein [Dialister invisus]|uniref:DUF1351 domain-containing protein n=1 Tax=Dialister invisus TaxID=218538 RepID=UPI00266F7E00|nr:DUF1351 domain-containing protein [Dialister invisus]